MADAQAWGQGWNLGENVVAQHRARQQQLEDEQRQAKEAALQQQLSSGAITAGQYGQGVNDLYAHEPAESRMGRLRRGLERAIGMRKTADTQKAQASAKVAGQPSPRRDFAAIESGAKTPQQLAEEANQSAIAFQGQLGKQKTEQERAAALQNVEDFKNTYKRMTGKDPSPEMLEAFTVSALGGDKVLSTMTQAEALKARIDYQNSTLALRKAQEELNQAKFDASQDPNNPMFKLRLQQASTAAMRAQATWESMQGRLFGTVNGVPLAGAMIDAEGNPIGSAFQSNVRPTGRQREQATLATSAIEQSNDVLSVLQSRPGLFGPGGGRLTQINQWLGTSDPDAVRVRAAAGTAADHLAGVFGGRNKEALQFLHEVSGGNVTMNPKAMAAGIEQLQKAAKTIQDIGSYRTVGGGEASPTGGSKGPAPKKTNKASDDADLLKRLTDATGGSSGPK